jgi:hypothetical protein
MDLPQYNLASRNLLSEATLIEGSKRPAYTGANEDVLFNFKAVAARMGINPMQAWGVYFLKHIDSITSYAKDPNIPQGEAMLGRFADAVNYLKLGYALLIEQEKVKEYSRRGRSRSHVSRSESLCPGCDGESSGLP